MKKLYAMIAGFLLFVIVVFGFDQHLDKQIMNNKEAVRNHRTYERFWSSETQKLVMDENTLPIFGSSELVSLEDYEENISSFLNSPDMNIVTIGGGYFQSLSHTMELGAIAENVESKKVAFLCLRLLILSRYDSLLLYALCCRAAFTYIPRPSQIPPASKYKKGRQNQHSCPQPSPESLIKLIHLFPLSKQNLLISIRLISRLFLNGS